MKFSKLISVVASTLTWALLLPASLMAESASKSNHNQPTDTGSASVKNLLLGNYEALLRDQNDAPFGIFKLTTGRNVWSASLETVGQARRRAKGKFILQEGTNSVSLETKFPATKTAPAVTLNFTLDGGSPFLFGTHGRGMLSGFKMIDSLAQVKKPIRYNLIMDQGEVHALDQPAGKGWASGSFTRTGIGSFRGMLGDATACSFPLRLSVTGQAILWAQPYRNKNSFIGGVIDVDNFVPNAENYESLEPSVHWVKVVDANTLSYRNGFTFDSMIVSGSRWLVPATHTALGNSLGWLDGEKCTVQAYGPHLFYKSELSAVNLPTEFRLDKSFNLIAPTNASTIRWRGRIVRGKGAFSGSFTLPAGFATDTISGLGAVSGLLLQDDVWGITTGLGLMKIPTAEAKGSFRTAAMALEQYETDTSAPTPTGMALIPAGSFKMGDSLDGYPEDPPPVTVNLSAFFIGKNEVTKALWDEVRYWAVVNGYSDLARGAGKATNHPVHMISWWDVVKWCNARSEKEGLTPVYTVNGAVMKTGTTAPIANWSANGYRLPTEAEWEKAARGGLSEKRFPWGDIISQREANFYPSNYDWYEDRTNVSTMYMKGSLPYTSPVGSFAANRYQLYDMTGNVSEWCWDWYGASAYTNGATDPRGADSGWSRVVRGGSYGDTAYVSRVVFRTGSAPTYTSDRFGFRVVRLMSETPPFIAPQPDSTLINSGSPATLSVMASGTGSLTYQWYQGAVGTTTSPVGANSASFTTPNLTSTTSYWVRVGNAAGNVNSAAYDVIIAKPAPAGMAFIPSGRFTMGDTMGDSLDDHIKAPPVNVNVSDFFIGINEVTKALWSDVRGWGRANGYTDLAVGAGDKPEQGSASIYPVHSISWFDMVKWCNARSQREGLIPVYTVNGAVMKTGTTDPVANWRANGYRLPTEAEWEKAARGGLLQKRFPWGDTISHSKANFRNGGGEFYQSGTTGDHPTYKESWGAHTSPVGSFTANGYGLHDMAGNVAEWCWDSYYDYMDGATDPRGDSLSSAWRRVSRGGSWRSYASYCLVAGRSYIDPTRPDSYIGFRVVRSSLAEMPLMITSQPVPTRINSGTTATLSITAIGPAPFLYQWYQGAVGSTTTPVGTNSSSFTTPALTATTSYWVRISNELGIANSTAVTVAVLPVITTQPDSIAVVSGQSASLAVVASGAGPLTYQWYEGAVGTTTSPVGTNSSNFTTPPLTTSTIYWVQVKNASESVNSDLATVMIGTPLPVDMALIPAGSFTMGDSLDSDSDAPRVTVNVSEFFMGRHEVTKELWREVRWWGLSNGYNDPAEGVGKWTYYPVHDISWFDMVKWCNARSEKEGLTPVYTVNGVVMRMGRGDPVANWSANGYRLPTEAEWEKAARGGLSGKRFPWGDTISHNEANFNNGGTEPYRSGTSGLHPTYATGQQPFTSPIGSFAANGYGLHDMAGNVSERCWDWYGPSTYVNGATDPKGAASGTDRVIRGGGWASNVASNCRVALRVSFSLPTGFRVARSSVSETPPMITTQSDSLTVVIGQSTSLAVVASGTWPLTYQWYEGAVGTTTSPVGTNSSNFTTPALTVTTKYWVEISNAFGEIQSSSLTVTVQANTAPTISDIAAQSINAGSNTGVIAFTIGDAQTVESSLTLSGSSSDTTLVPNANIVFGGSGASRTVTVTPASSQSGTATITVTVTVSDGSLTASDTFVLTVVNAPAAPTGFSLIPSGSFTMGDALDGDGNAPTHTVTVSAFYMAQNLVTQAQWDTVRTWANSNGYSDLPAGAGKASNHPVQTISWFQMVKWCNARSQQEGLTPVYYTNDAQTTVYKTGDVNVTNAQVKWAANGYRLPTEAEWEKAARGGLSGKRFPWGDTISQSQANYYATSGYSYDLSGAVNNHHPTYATGSFPYTSPVGSFAANGYGLYDMTGNVWQWCWDWYGTYDTGTLTDPRGVSSGTGRVRRGGSWYDGAYYCRVAGRGSFGPSYASDRFGFRVARSSVMESRMAL